MANDIVTTVSLSDNPDAAQLIADVAAGRRESVDLEASDRRSGAPVTVRVRA